MCTTSPCETSLTTPALFHNWIVDKNTNALAQNQEENTSTGAEFQNRIDGELWRWMAYKVLKVLVAKLGPTLYNPMACSQPGSSVHGISQAKSLEWIAIPFSGGSSQTQGLNPVLLHCRWIPYCLKVKVTQSYPTLCNPMDYTVHGILQASHSLWSLFDEHIKFQISDFSFFFHLFLLVEA